MHVHYRCHGGTTSEYRPLSLGRAAAALGVAQFCSSSANTRPASVIAAYFRRRKIRLKVAHEIDNLGMMMSMVASTRGVALLPSYAENFLPWAVTSRPLTGDPPTIELLLGSTRRTNRPY